MDDYPTVFLIILYAFIFTFGLIGNFVIILFFGFKMKRENSFRWFIIQLSIADSICCIFTTFFYFYLLTSNGEWHLGNFACKAFTPVGSLTVTVSAWILCGIAFERYRAIVFPLQPRLCKTTINMFCFIVWTGSFILSLPFFLYTDVNQEQICQPVLTSSQLLFTAVSTLIIQSVIPFIFMATVFIGIQSAFRENARNNSARDELAIEPNSAINLEHASQSTFEDNDKNNSVQIGLSIKQSDLTKSAKKREKETLITLRLAVLVFILCSLPYNIFYVVAIYMFHYHKYTEDEQERYSPIYDQFHIWLSSLLVMNSVLNCFIYAGKFPDFRQYLASLCKMNRKNRRYRYNSSRFQVLDALSPS